MVTDKECDLPEYYNPGSLMNILALRDTMNCFRVTMDMNEEVAILVHITKDKVMRFVEIGAGLYIWKPEDNSSLLNKQISSYSFLGLVSENKSSFTRRELKRIDEARNLFIILGMPGYPKFFKDLENKRIRDCEITLDDAKDA